MKFPTKCRILDCNKITGFVDYGEVDLTKNGGYSTKMRCKKCGAAWLDVNHQNGRSECPKCRAKGKDVAAGELKF